MGCDIHCHAEIKVNGKWEHWNNLQIRRNYSLFAKMAGVRGTEEPVAMPRGFPEDASFTTKYDFDYWNGDAHTPSWLSSEEVAQIGKWYEETHQTNGRSAIWERDVVGYIFGNGWDFKSYDDSFENLPHGFEDARLVFWFDN